MPASKRIAGSVAVEKAKTKKIKKKKIEYPKSTMNLIKDIQKIDNLDGNINNNDIIDESNNEETIKTKLLSKILIPKCFNDGLFLNDIKEDDENVNKTLKGLWKDFNLYDYIIDNFKSNIWGIENLCRKVKMDYTGEFLKECKHLIKEYSVNSKYRNILFLNFYKFI